MKAASALSVDPFPHILVIGSSYVTNPWRYLVIGIAVVAIAKGAYPGWACLADSISTTTAPVNREPDIQMLPGEHQPAHGSCSGLSDRCLNLLIKSEEIEEFESQHAPGLLPVLVIPSPRTRDPLAATPRIDGSGRSARSPILLC
jgi:hypothetical protein